MPHIKFVFLLTLTVFANHNFTTFVLVFVIILQGNASPVILQAILSKLLAPDLEIYLLHFLSHLLHSHDYKAGMLKLTVF